jgi:hypothetical protein
MARRLFYQLVAVAIAAVLPATMLAQDASLLKLTVVSGNGAVHDLRTNSTVPTIVELRDDRDQPVLRGAVTFMLPETGPGGRFADGSRSLFVLTDPRGRATLTGFIPNQQEGPFQIAVEATASGNTARAMIRQFNNSVASFSASRPADPGAGVTARRGSGAGTKILVTLVLGVAVAAGSIIALKNGGNGKTPPTTTVSIGGVSVGGPR